MQLKASTLVASLLLALAGIGCQSTANSNVKETTVGNGHAQFPNRVIVGTVVAVASAAPTTPPPVSEHAPNWQVATVNIERVVSSAVDGTQIDVRFQGSNDVAWIGWPKLAVGEHAQMLIHLDNVTGLPGKAYLVQSGDDIRAIDTSPLDTGALLAQLASGSGPAASALSAAVNAETSAGRALAGGGRLQSLGFTPSLSLPATATLLERLTYSAPQESADAGDQIYVTYGASAGSTSVQSVVRTQPLNIVTVSDDLMAQVSALAQDLTLGENLQRALASLAAGGYHADAALQAKVIPGADEDASLQASLLDLRYRSQDMSEQHLILVYSDGGNGRALTSVLRTGESH